MRGKDVVVGQGPHGTGGVPKAEGMEVSLLDSQDPLPSQMSVACTR